MNLLILLVFIITAHDVVEAANDDTRNCVARRVIDVKDKGVREFANCLGNDVESGQSDLVVVLDRSGSMGWPTPTRGYIAAKSFINSLLSEVKVSFNATRISVITFANDVTNEINYLENPTPVNNKCEFEKKFVKLRSPAGATNIRGGLDEAYSVFSRLDDDIPAHKTRTRSNRVVLLLSDGQPNVSPSGNPRDVYIEADRIKLSSITLYTVAVSGADQGAMKSWASNPTAAIYAPSFKKMAELAHSIRGGSYKPLSFFLKIERIQFSLLEDFLR